MTAGSNRNDDVGALAHWHPVLPSSALHNGPVGVSVLGTELVLFRTRSGVVGALDDRCPHRGARLSTGFVKDQCVVCPYHLWTFDCDGRGHSPVNENMKPFTRAFDVTEQHGHVWLKLRSSALKMPPIDGDGLYYIGSYFNYINAPFELVVDNFTEIEHSPTNHFMFAFDAEGIKHVEPQVKVFADWIHVNYTGPQRPVPWWAFGRLIGIKAGIRHVIDFQVKFSPIHWIYDLHWEDPKTGERLPQRVREFAFITPQDSRSTAVLLLFFTSVKLFAPGNPARSFCKRLFFSRMKYEFFLDKRICENVAGMDPSTELTGRQLGKFDHVLRSTRKLIDLVYYRFG